MARRLRSQRSVRAGRPEPRVLETPENLQRRLEPEPKGVTYDTRTASDKLRFNRERSGSHAKLLIWCRTRSYALWLGRSTACSARPADDERVMHRGARSVVLYEPGGGVAGCEPAVSGSCQPCLPPRFEGWGRRFKPQAGAASCNRANRATAPSARRVRHAALVAVVLAACLMPAQATADSASGNAPAPDGLRAGVTTLLSERTAPPAGTPCPYLTVAQVGALAGEQVSLQPDVGHPEPIDGIDPQSPLVSDNCYFVGRPVSKPGKFSYDTSVYLAVSAPNPDAAGAFSRMRADEAAAAPSLPPVDAPQVGTAAYFLDVGDTDGVPTIYVQTSDRIFSVAFQPSTAFSPTPTAPTPTGSGPERDVVRSLAKDVIASLTTPESDATFTLVGDTGHAANSLIGPLLSGTALLQGAGAAVAPAPAASFFDTWRVPLDLSSGKPVVSGRYPRVPPDLTPRADDMVECLQVSGASDNPGGPLPEGRVHNRFLWCFGGQFDYVAPGKNPGKFTLDIIAVAYGRDDGNRSVRVFLRTDGAWWSGRGVGPETLVRVGVQCAPPGSGPSQVSPEEISYTRCRVAERSNPAESSRTLAEWARSYDWLSWDVVSNADGLTSAVADGVLRHQWQLTSSALGRVATGGLHTIRCDSAPYFSYFGKDAAAACIFDDVKPHLRWSLFDPRIGQIVDHISLALHFPWDTEPEVFGRSKVIPGEYGKGTFALHRLRPDSPLRALNRTDAQIACDALRRKVPWDTRGMDCDEYPFACTLEGAASNRWDFSVEYVDPTQNRRAGGLLSWFFTSDRILYDTDPFYVEITADQAPAEAYGFRRCRPNARRRRPLRLGPVLGFVSEGPSLATVRTSSAKTSLSRLTPNGRSPVEIPTGYLAVNPRMATDASRCARTAGSCPKR
jgi:hypothetical protein